MKKIILILMIILSAILMGAEYSTDQIVEFAEESIKVEGFEAVSRLIIRDGKGNEKERKIAQIGKLYDEGTTTKTLMRFLYPADVKGTGFLSYVYEEDKDNDQWLYLPSLRKVRKIASSEKGNSFMGSEFSYGDISGLKKVDFDFELLGAEKIEGEDCWKLEAVPKTEDKADEYGFMKKVIFISKNDYVIRKALLYDFDEEVFKEMQVLKVEEVDKEQHKYKPMHMIMKNLENDRESEMIMDQIVLNRNVDDEYFSFRYLQRE